MKYLAKLVLFVILQTGLGSVPWSDTTSGEDMVSKQAYEMEENGKPDWEHRRWGWGYLHELITPIILLFLFRYFHYYS